MKTHFETDWNRARLISDHPLVDEAIRNLADDPTNDNAVCLVRAVIDATKPNCQMQHQWVSKAALDVNAERRRQVEELGYGPEHE